MYGESIAKREGVEGVEESTSVVEKFRLTAENGSFKEREPARKGLCIMCKMYQIKEKEEGGVLSLYLQ